MADFTLADKGHFLDIYIDENGHVVSNGPDIETAVAISIFTDRRANDGDEVEGTNRRGCWIDTYRKNKIGSRLWLLGRRKATAETLKQAKEMVEECLAWIVDDGVAEEVVVENEWANYDPNRMNLLVQIIKPDESVLTFKFNYAWDFS